MKVYDGKESQTERQALVINIFFKILRQLFIRISEEKKLNVGTYTYKGTFLHYFFSSAWCL